MIYTALTPSLHKRCYKISLEFCSHALNALIIYYNLYSKLDFSAMFCQCKILSSSDSILPKVRTVPLSEKGFGWSLRNIPSSAKCLRQPNLKKGYRPYPETFIRQQRNKDLSKIFEFSCHSISRMDQLHRGVRVTGKTYKQNLKQSALVGKHGCLCTVSFVPEVTSQMIMVRLGKLELAASCE